MDIDEAIRDVLKDCPEWLKRFNELCEAASERDDLAEQVDSLQQEDAETLSPT